MEFAIDLARPEDGDRVGQKRIHPSNPGARRTLGLGIEVDDLQPRVYPAVGSPGGGHLRGRAGDCREGRLERVLHRAAARLRLPAEETAAVVFESEGNARHEEKSGSDPDFPLKNPYPILPRSCSAWPFCEASPSFITSPRSSRAPSLSPISSEAFARSSLAATSCHFGSLLEVELPGSPADPRSRLIEDRSIDGIDFVAEAD